MATFAELPKLDVDALRNLRSRMNNFTSFFDQFISVTRQHLSAERSDFMAGMAQDRLNQRKTMQAISHTRKEQSDLGDALKVEKSEVEGIQKSIVESSSQKEMISQRTEALKQEIQHVQELLTSKRQVIKEKRQALGVQNSQNKPELYAWERQLGLQIDGAGKDMVRITYKLINPKDSNMPHFFILNFSSAQYEVDECHPAIPACNHCVAALNKDKDISAFLKQMRQEYRLLYKSTI